MADIIYSTEMNPTAKIRALTLLELAHPDNGHVTLEWGELTDLWNCSKGTVRRQLGAIHEAGLIHYSSNGDGVVYVTFKHLSRAHARNSAKISRESARPRAENALPEATPPAAADDAARAHARNSAKISRESARPRAENALPEANYSHGCADAGLVGWLDGSTIQTDPSPSNQPADPQPPTPTAPPAEAPAEALTDEQTTAFALLSEIRMRPDKAMQIARTVPLPLIRDAVGAWWSNRKSAGGKLHEQPGVVVAHLLNGRTLLPLPPDSWPQDPLYQRHRTRAERDADAAAGWRSAEVELEPDAPAAQPLAPLRPKPEPGTPAAFWCQLQADFALHQPAGSIDSTLQNSWVIAYADGVFTIGIGDAFRLDWVERKLRNQVRRRLAVIMGRPDVDVHFQALPDGAP